MKRFCLIFTVVIISISIMASCNEKTNKAGSHQDSSTTSSTTTVTNVKEETVIVPADSTSLKCFVAYDDTKKGPRPVVLVVPEWWGLNDYTKSRARQLATLGYLAMVVDMYGNGRVAANPDEAKALAGGFYGNPKLGENRILAALAKAKTYPQADTTKTAAIGYCFGGSMVLNAAKMGSPFDGVVSFHGGLAGVTPAKNTIKSKILVCHGMADKFISPQEVASFRKQLDSVGATYTFKEYPDATHAFTNPESNENARKFNMPIAYNAEADKNSWNDMKAFFATLW